MVEEAKAQMRDILGKRADWNLTIYDFTRYSELLKQGAYYAVQIRFGNYEACKNLYAIEAELIAEWHGIMKQMNKTLTKEFEDKIENLGKNLERGITETTRGNYIHQGLPKELLTLWQDLHDFKQEAGLGLPMRKEITDEDRLERSMR